MQDKTQKLTADMSMDVLPSVAGCMEMTHADFQNGCQVELARLQADPLCDSRLVYLLCEAVRCSRECCKLVEMNLDPPAMPPPALRSWRHR